VGVQFEIDANGILHVLARDVKTGRQSVQEMKSAVDVADAEVQKMVEESVEHAMEDLRARRWIESTLQARETAAATRKALAECSGEIDEACRNLVEQALKAVEDLLAGEKCRHTSGRHSSIKSSADQA